MSPDPEKILDSQSVEAEEAEVIRKPVKLPISPDEDDEDGPRSVKKDRDLSDFIAASGGVQKEGESKKPAVDESVSESE